MNWRRRELMRSRCPHLVLVSHNANGFILPTVCDFDAQIYGEGRSFDSLEGYWERPCRRGHGIECAGHDLAGRYRIGPLCDRRCV